MVLKGVCLAFASVIAAVLTTQSVSAEGLRIQPLMYQEKLAVSEKKKAMSTLPILAIRQSQRNSV